MFLLPIYDNECSFYCLLVGRMKKSQFDLNMGRDSFCYSDGAGAPLPNSYIFPKHVNLVLSIYLDKKKHIIYIPI